MKKPTEYRIVQRGVNHFDIQQKLFGLFWIDSTEYGSSSVEEARETIKAWAASDAVRGKVFSP